eukprot:1998184-Amphidinium_carterae.1
MILNEAINSSIPPITGDSNFRSRRMIKESNRCSDYICSLATLPCPQIASDVSMRILELRASSWHP